MIGLSGCSSLTSVTIGNSVTSIGGGTFNGCSALTSVISKMDNPCSISDGCFDKDVFYDITLYVPQGKTDVYKATNYWNKFVFIEEGDGPNGNEQTEPEKCEKPTIGYANGKLTFSCDTEGATCQYTITDSDIKSGSGEEIQLAVTYNISVYATKSGYENSETATATLCWIESTPEIDGLSDSIDQIQARAILVTTNNGIVNVTGADEGELVSVCGVNGEQQGSSVSRNGVAHVPTLLPAGTVAVVKIGQRVLKVVMK